MSTIGKPERATQDWLIALFRQQLGYTYLGKWSDRADNSNIEEGFVAASLAMTVRIIQSDLAGKTNSP
ncbi:MAG: hypothetical protein ACO3JG_13285 [Luteolibacter sp.]